MFSGIIESVQPVLTAQKGEGVIRIQTKKPSEFSDLKIGDSIATDGVCLTLEAFDEQSLTCALAFETLQVLKWP
jgi:riboflavin synthase